MKTLRQAVGDYLALRRSLGFKLKDHEPCLWKFILFLEKKRSTRISIPLALLFATQHQHQQPAQWAARLRVVRGFARPVACIVSIATQKLKPTKLSKLFLEYLYTLTLKTYKPQPFVRSVFDGF